MNTDTLINLRMQCLQLAKNIAEARIGYGNSITAELRTPAAMTPEQVIAGAEKLYAWVGMKGV